MPKLMRMLMLMLILTPPFPNLLSSFSLTCRYTHGRLCGYIQVVNTPSKTNKWDSRLLPSMETETLCRLTFNAGAKNCARDTPWCGPEAAEGVGKRPQINGTCVCAQGATGANPTASNVRPVLALHLCASVQRLFGAASSPIFLCPRGTDNSWFQRCRQS